MYEHYAAVLRGWYPHWQAQMRAWTGNDYALYAVLIVVMLMTVRSLNRGR